MLFFGGCIEERLDVIMDVLLEDYILLDFKNIATYKVEKSHDGTLTMRAMYSNNLTSLDKFTFRAFNEDYKEYILSLEDLYSNIRDMKVYSRAGTIYKFKRSEVVLYRYIANSYKIPLLNNYKIVLDELSNGRLIAKFQTRSDESLELRYGISISNFWKDYSKALILDS